MPILTFTLLADGSSDRALIPVLRWLLRQQDVSCAIVEQWVDPSRFPAKLVRMTDKLRFSVEIYPADLLFVHRDAEKQPLEARREEINGALREAFTDWNESPSAICVVPVRMTEAWLLLDECAIRKAAGNPSGAAQLALPQAADWENLPDPKEVLFHALRSASELRGRRLKRFSPHDCLHRMSEEILDFAALRTLRAFQVLESDVRNLVQMHAWNRL